jgi:hypothetical protein
MKRTLTFLTVFGMVLALSTVALAGDNFPVASAVASAVDPQAACATGSCFVPAYNADGEVAVYKGPGTGTVQVWAADCCIAGDNYKLIIKSAVAKDKVKWMSAGSLDGSCSVGPWPDERSVTLAGAKKIKLKGISFPGGFPAAGYVRINQSGWVQKKGTDACGF